MHAWANPLGRQRLARAEAGGVTHIMTQPWWFYDGPDATLDQKIDAMSRYREDFLPG